MKLTLLQMLARRTATCQALELFVFQLQQVPQRKPTIVNDKVIRKLSMAW
jgi:hypothetical protein